MCYEAWRSHWVGSECLCLELQLLDVVNLFDNSSQQGQVSLEVILEDLPFAKNLLHCGPVRSLMLDHAYQEAPSPLELVVAYCGIPFAE